MASFNSFSLFSNNSILQRDKDCPVWGYGEPNSTVDVSLIGVKANGKKYIKKFSATADANGRWQIVIPKLPAGGEYTLTAKSGEKKVVSTNITFGDLWICSGQSNMEMSYGWGLTRGREDIETASYDNVRLLMVPNYVTLVPTKNLTEGWTLCTPEKAKRFSACGARIGTVITRNKELQAHMMKICQARLSVATLDQVASAALYSVDPSYFDEVRAEYKERRDTLYNKLMEIPGVVCKEPKGAFYVMAKLPVDDTEKFLVWLLTEFEDNNETVMYAPGGGFYATEGKGTDEVRFAYILKKEDLARAMDLLAMGIKKYNETH